MYLGIEPSNLLLSARVLVHSCNNLMKQEALQMQRDCTLCHRYQISHFKRLAIREWPSRSLKVITIAVVRQAVYKHHFLVVACCYNISIWHYFRDITTFTIWWLPATLRNPSPLTHTEPFYSSLDFVWNNPGELVPEGTFCHLLDFFSAKWR